MTCSPISNPTEYEFVRRIDELEIRSRGAEQQPDWQHDPELLRHVDYLRRSQPLTSGGDVIDLRDRLRAVAGGRGIVLQAGDCAEDPAETSVEQVARKLGLIQSLACALEFATASPVIRVGRLAGQFAKPRSAATETMAGIKIPVYRGHMINHPAPDLAKRRATPERLVTSYRAARSVMTILDRIYLAGGQDTVSRVWTSHEALVLDYELPMVRQHGACSYLSSTHWPWIGNRTNQPLNAHVALAAGIINPVACKIGPDVSVDAILALCTQLDARREAGRLTLIARMGASHIATSLPPLMQAVERAGHPVIWMCDPMHGNTVTTPDGQKTRYLTDIVAEVQQFRRVCATVGVWPGGLHLETSIADVQECFRDPSGPSSSANKYTSLCDPRLNAEQAMTVVGSLVEGWADV